MTVRTGERTRRLARTALQESFELGHTERETVRHLGKRLDMGAPAARTLRDYLIRNPEQ